MLKIPWLKSRLGSSPSPGTLSSQRLTARPLERTQGNELVQVSKSVSVSGLKSHRPRNPLTVESFSAVSAIFYYSVIRPEPCYELSGEPGAVQRV